MALELRVRQLPVEAALKNRLYSSLLVAVANQKGALQYFPAIIEYTEDGKYWQEASVVQGANAEQVNG